jgi:response regulator RpfG family c-di-GMP phosphodiesterase
MVATQAPDLILLDIMMPGIDGYQVAAKLKSDRATANIPIAPATWVEQCPPITFNGRVAPCPRL